MSAPQSPVPADFAPPAFDDTDTLSIRSLLSVVRQRLHVAIAIFVLIAIATVVFVHTRTPLYTATTRLIVEPRENKSPDAPAARANLNPRDLLKTHILLIKSAPVLKRALQAVPLNPSPSLSNLAQMLEMGNSGLIIDVSFTHKDPATAADFLNAVADAYLEENRTLAANANGGDTGGLGEKAGDLRARLDDAEAALRAFADENDLGSFEDTKLLAGERYRDLAKNLVAAESRRIAAETQFDSAREALESGSAVESIPGVLESPVVTSLKLELAALQRQESDLAALDGDADAPARLKSVRAQTAALQAQIRAEAERLVESLRARLEQLKGEESLLRDALDEQKKQVAGFNEIDARYRRLLQTRDSLRESYDSVSRSLDELDTANLANQGDSVFVVARADVPSAPSWPNRPKMLVLGLFFGLLFGIGVCFILDFFDTSVKTAADVHACVRRPLLGSVPAKCGRKKAPNDFYAIDHPHSAFAEAFRTICTRLSFSAAGGPVRSLVVSSAGPDEGKSLCALNLAIACAQSSKRVLLVDADLRTPALAKVFPDAPAKGLSDLLAEGSDSLSTTVASTQIPNLSFLPAGTIPPNPVALLDSPRFADLLQTLSSQYDLVVFDTPSCLDKVDALVLAKQAGGLVYVLRASASNKFSTRQSIRQLETANVPILGAILNGVSA